MKILLIIVGIVFLIVAVFAIYRFLKVKQQRAKIAEQRFERIKPLVDKLDKGQIVTSSDIRPFAANILTRESTYQLLKDRQLLNLFPVELQTIEKGAESNLAIWLEFPTELDGCPDEIEHVKKVTIPYDKDNNVYYHVFKFRINEPHWAAKDGWMLGVVGPFFDDSMPYDFPHATFSRLSSKFESTSPDEEAKWVHENISMKN